LFIADSSLYVHLGGVSSAQLDNGYYHASHHNQRRLHLVLRLLVQDLIVMVVMTLGGWGTWNVGSDSLSSQSDSLTAHPDPIYVAGCPVPDPLKKSSKRGGVGKGRGCTEEVSSHPITSRRPEGGLGGHCTQPKGKGKIISPGELQRPCLPRTRMRNRATGKGGPWGNQRVTRERRRSCSQKVETHPTDTLASADESAMNFRVKFPFLENPLHAANFGEFPFYDVR